LFASFFHLNFLKLFLKLSTFRKKKKRQLNKNQLQKLNNNLLLIKITLKILLAIIIILLENLKKIKTMRMISCISEDKKMN